MGSRYRDEANAALSRAASLEDELRERDLELEQQRERIRALEETLSTQAGSSDVEPTSSVRAEPPTDDEEVEEQELESEPGPALRQRLVAVQPRQQGPSGGPRFGAFLLFVLATTLGGLFAWVFLR